MHDADYLPLFIIAIVVPVIWAIIVYNRFIKYQNMIEESWSGIDVTLKRRFNLIPNLIEAVKLYGKHESEVLESVTHQRVSSEAMVDRTEHESAISQSLQNLLAVAEAYPDLKANQNFLMLQHSLNEIEKEVQTARQQYNGAVRRKNTLVQSFPSNLIARLFNFRSTEYFSLELATQRELPKVS